jgi:hypothetical protein
MFDRTRLEITEELKRARGKFPAPNKNYIALVEEVGELAKALLDCRPGDHASNKAVYDEAMQVATMAIRVMEEGDPTTAPGYTPHLGMAGG